MRRFLWLWPLLVLGALVFLPWGCYRLEPSRPLAVVVLDKTVPFDDRIEHRSFFWLMNHLKIVRPDGERFDRDRDYLGAFPGPMAGDPPSWTVDLSVAAAEDADLLYLVDTYGVYRDDLASGAARKTALERSPKIYGGLQPAEVTAVERALDAEATVVVEFNSFASPTAASTRARMERLLGVRWTHWIGRYFPLLEDAKDVPRWLRETWEREWQRPWKFRGAGYVLFFEDRHCEVLEVGEHTEAIGLTLTRNRPIDPLLASAHDGVPYGFWFDVVETRGDAETLAWFEWRLTDEGRARLRGRDLPGRFPAVVRRGRAHYFAGDFADGPMPDRAVPLRGYLILRRTAERMRLKPSSDAFYWRFYAPLMHELLARVEH